MGETMKHYRNSTQIVCDLLTVTQNSGQNGITVTPLCQKGNLSHNRLRNILSKLIGMHWTRRHGPRGAARGYITIIQNVKKSFSE